jgi:RNA polymerase sigma factor (sigma-70 family)
MTVKSFSDEMLLPALKKQDEQAIKYIYHACWPMILQLVKVNNGNEDEAKDIFQESMLDFLEKLWNGNLVLTCKIQTFIYSICRNKWLYHLRGKQKFVDVEAYIILEKPMEELPEERAGLPNDEQIRMAITALGEPCQSLLIGFYYKGLSMELLAKKLNYKSANVVKQQKFRCKDRLKQALIKF